MAIIQQVQVNESSLNQTIRHLLKAVTFSSLARTVNYHRRSSVSLTAVVVWLMNALFLRESMHRAKDTDQFTKRTARNVLNDGRINWTKLTLFVASRVITTLFPVIDHRRKTALIVDDTLLDRPYATHADLLSWVRDHDQGKTVRGYRGLTVAWSDGNTTLPLTMTPMASAKPKMRIGDKTTTFDQRTMAGRRRTRATHSMYSEAIDQIDLALKSGIKTDFVLFDSWYAYPKLFWHLLQAGVSGLGMMKRTNTIKVRYNQRDWSIKALYVYLLGRLKTHDTYKFAVTVDAHNEAGDTFKLRLVFVNNRGNRNDYMVLATTCLTMRPEQVIQMYARRWQIEVYFKFTKQYLQLNRCQIQSYDGFVAHLAIVMITYDALALNQRENADPRTLGDLFFSFFDALPDIQITEALAWLQAQLMTCIQGDSTACDRLIDNVIDEFVTMLNTGTSRLLSA